MALMFLFLLPTALYSFGVLKSDVWKYILLINPIQAAQEVIMGGFKGVTLDWQYYFSLVYLLIGGFLSYKFLIVPYLKNTQFDKRSVIVMFKTILNPN
jgi:hypothetical protein